MRVHTTVAGLGILVATSGMATAADPPFYFQNFDAVDGFELVDAGFTGNFWKLELAGTDKYIVSIPPIPPAQESVAISPRFPFTTDGDLKGSFAVQYQLRFPGTWEVPPESSKRTRYGRALLVPSETSADLVAPDGQPLLTLLFRPKPPAGEEPPDPNPANLILFNHRTGQQEVADTETITPFGQGSESGTIDLKIAFVPDAALARTTIRVSYGEGGNFVDSPLIVHTISGLVPIDRLTFRHRAGTGMTNDVVRVDAISVRANDRLLLPTHPHNGFDRDLRLSNGSNTSDVFDAQSYFQATFRLSRSFGGEDYVGDWDKRLGLLGFLKSSSHNLHGIPLLITKADFTAVQPDSPPVISTFFMTTFATDAIFHQDITILSTPAFQISADPVVAIELEVDGQLIEVEPTGSTPLRFMGTGETVILATVRFASGFTGQNLFRVIVRDK